MPIILRLILSISFLLVVLPAFAKDNFTKWHGVGIQIDGQDWSMEISLGEEKSTVDYPTTDCGGEWRHIRKSKTKLVAVEILSYGIDLCLDAGLINLVPVGEDRLLYQWFDSAGKIAATAILVPGELREDNYDALLKLTLEEVGLDFIEGPESFGITVDDNQL